MKSPALPPKSEQIRQQVNPILDQQWPEDGFGPLQAIVAALPDPGAIGDGGWLEVQAGSGPKRTIWQRLSGQKPVFVHGSVRATALFLAGYQNVRAEPGLGGRGRVWGEGRSK